MIPLRIFHALLLTGALLVSAVVQAAGPRVAILSDDHMMSRQVRHMVELGLRHADVKEIVSGELQGPALLAREDLLAADVTLLVGQAALRQALGLGVRRNIVVVLLSNAALDTELAKFALRGFREVHAIVLDQPIRRYFDLIRLSFPDRRRIGLMLGPDVSLPKNIEKQAEERGMTLNVVRIAHDSATESSAAFISTLESLLGRSDLLLALPDAYVHTRTTIQPLLLTTYRAGVPVVAYSEAYGRAGALLTLYSTQEQLARQAVEVLRQLMQGGNVPQVQSPRHFSVNVNATVARSLGLRLPSADTLREQMYQYEKTTE